MDSISSTVIICIYNRATQALRCFESLLAMDHQDFEIVLVDDASTDDTPRQLEKFQQSHPDRPIVIVRNERNLGVSGARNAGLAVAKERFVCFTDSDCTVDRRWLGKMIGGLETPGVAAVAGLVLNTAPTNLAERANAGQTRIRQTRWQNRTLVGGNMGLRREIALECLFDEALSYGCDEDDLAWRMRSDGHRIAHVPEAVVHHHHPLTLGSYLSMGYRRGIGSARYWYKKGVYLGRDLWAGFAALLALPLGVLDVRLLVVPIFFAGLELAAIAFNEMALKNKSLIETVCVLPVCILYQACKASGVLAMWLRLALGRERSICESKRRWRNRQRSRTS